MKNLDRKKFIRKELLNRRNSLPQEICEKYSKLIETRLLSLPIYQTADTLLIYASYNNEVNTYSIIEDALNHSKRVYCPKVLEPGVMKFYHIRSLNDIVAGYRNIPEPIRTDCIYDYKSSANTLMIMPLVGYDSHKVRLGYGGGFYDRYLQRFPLIPKIALGYECQKYEPFLPSESTDIKPDYILTEEKLF